MDEPPGATSGRFSVDAVAMPTKSPYTSIAVTAVNIRGGGRGGGWFAAAAWFAWALSVVIRFVMAGNAGL
jgi:hypothetical protein